MKPVTCTLLLCALALPLLACDSGPGPQQAAPQPATPAATLAAPVEETDKPLPAAGQFEINLTPGNISIRANQADELAILDSIATSANFELLTGEISWRTVTVNIQAEVLRSALAELLAGYAYQFVYTPDTDSPQEVLSAVVVDNPPPPDSKEQQADAGQPAPATPDNGEEEADPEQQAQLQKLQSPQAEIRAEAVADIDPTGEALVQLTELVVNDPSPQVRIAASQALEFSDDPLALQALAGCLKDENVEVLLECISSLEYAGDKMWIPHLQPLTSHYDLSVRNAAAEAIENLQ